jgi:hypothetical protein
VQRAQDASADDGGAQPERHDRESGGQDPRAEHRQQEVPVDDDPGGERDVADTKQPRP